MPNNNCCIKDNEDACDHSGIPTSCDMDECTPKNINDIYKFCCSKKSTFKDGKYICEPNSPPPTKRTCANPGEDVYTPNTFTQTPAPCCDGQKPDNNKMGLKVLLGILIFLWFVTLGVFIYTKYKIGK